VGVRLLGGITVNRLAEAMVMDRTTLTRNLKPLENQGLIQTVPGSDRREREITLTPTGESMLAKALPLWKKAQGQVQQDIGKDRFGRLLTDLQATVEATQAG
jgi:DNA-binding MarR family transcriptional regulator